ncbi:MAG TPA: prepilin peptidase [Terriglobia bacterium]|nr:prepilin peptidase [Terriglobia bacterium]
MHSFIWSHVAAWAVALLVALWAGWLDLRFRRIPNWLTVSGFVLGLATNGILFGWTGVAGGLEGAGIAIAVLIVPVVLRGIGAGDLKLMIALGACLGPWKFLNVLLASIFIAGFMAVVEIVRKRRIRQTLTNLLILIRAFVTFGLGARESIVTLDDPGTLRLPFGVAIALAVVLVVFTNPSLLTF